MIFISKLGVREGGRRWAAVGASVVLLLVLGCGAPDDQPELGEVSGTITKGGEPLADAWVEFLPKEGRLSAARTDANGKYVLNYTYEAPGAKVGTHTVKIGIGGKGYDPTDYQSLGGQQRKLLLEKSGVTVKPGENTLDFEINEGNE